jgi:hypothetical protein
VGPRAVLDAVVKRKIPSPRRESNPRTPIVQPVAQRYTDWDITALHLPLCRSKMARRRKAPRLLNLGTTLRWVFSFMRRQMYPHWKSPRHLLCRRLGGHRGGQEKNHVPTRDQIPIVRCVIWTVFWSILLAYFIRNSVTLNFIKTWSCRARGQIKRPTSPLLVRWSERHGEPYFVLQEVPGASLGPVTQ